MFPDKKERLIQSAATILDKTPNKELNIVILNKTIFYLDLVSLLENGETITGNTFIALPNGPVVAKYPRRLVKPMEDLGIATQQTLADGRKPVRLLKSQAVPDYLESFQESAEKIANFFSTSEHASNYSHNNPGWQAAIEMEKREGQKQPINMLIALQQLSDDADWLNEPLREDDMESIVADADGNLSEIW